MLSTKEILYTKILKGGETMAKRYNLEFKKMAVELTKNGASTIKTAKDLNIPLKTFENWITAYNKDPHIFDPDYVSPQEEIKRLQKIIKEQQETIDILKKAAAFFAKAN